MAAVVFLHGFLSSPQAHKAVLSRDWLQQYHSEVTFYAPELSPYPEQTEQTLRALIPQLLGHPIGLIGSSLGGFWCHWLLAQLSSMSQQVRGVLVNPSVRPFETLQRVLNEPIFNYETGEQYQFNGHHVEQLRQFYQPVVRWPKALWVLLQTGDEVLDYREAAAYYQHCRLTIENGGDHGFRDYALHLPEIYRFLLDARQF